MVGPCGFDQYGLGHALNKSGHKNWDAFLMQYNKRKWFWGVLLFYLATFGCAAKQPCVPPAHAPQQVREAIQDLCGRDPSKRAKAAIELGQMGSGARAAIPYLIWILEDARTLKWGCAHGPDIGKKHSRKVSPGDRAAAALASIAGSPDTYDQVLQALGQALSGTAMDFRGQANAVLALGKIGTSDTVPLLIGALTHGAFPVRMRAVDALSDIDDPRVSPALETALSDKHEKVRAKARSALDSRK